MEQQKGLDFGPGAEKPKPQRRTWTVSQLTDRLQGVLETEFSTSGSRARSRT